MVVAAHPDDELLGLGATMHKLIREQGVKVHVIILGEGITSRSDTRDTEKWKDVLAEHHRNINAAEVMSDMILSIPMISPIIDLTLMLFLIL